MEKLVPKLRFPEFEGNWEKKKLGNICQMTSSKRVYLEDYVESGIPFYRGKEITELKNNQKPSDILFISNERYLDFKEKYGVPKINDILITAVGTLGNVWKISNEEPFYFKDGNLIWLKDIDENSDFVEKLIQLNTSILIKTSIGSTQKALTMVELRKIELNFPQPEEQQKIASFLTSVDERLTLLAQQKEKLELYKKGVMQQIFPSTSSGQAPKLRFKDENGNNYPDWEEKKLGEIFKIGSGKDYKHLNKGNIPVYGTGGYMTSVDQYLYDGESVGIGRKGTIDKPVFLKGKFWTVDTLFYTHNFINVLPYFVYLIFQTIDWVSNNEGSGVPSLSKSTIEKIKTKVPSIEEQQKIASFLSAIDVQIEGVSKKIEQTKLFKKGLLQQMFV